MLLCNRRACLHELEAMLRALAILLKTLTGLILLVVAPVMAMPEPGPVAKRWQASGAGAAIDHAPFDAFLVRYRSVGSDGIARLAYGRVTKNDRAMLDAYVAALGAAPIAAMTRPQQMALWINLYNAATVQVVLDAYPVKSILWIRDGLLPTGPWKRSFIRVGGESLSLDDIEHGILRPLWRDPRIHYAVNCASLGCPDLGAKAFRAETLEAQLDAAASAFINHPRGVRIGPRSLKLSSIFKWYGDDFGDAASLRAHLRRYAQPPLSRALDAGLPVRGDSYSWTLNDAR